ncbi:MAG: UDP-N-acetylmuramate dehydrogenase [Chlorobi bacterium]|nr:UDP-N-acetylmuramate dehydrogenase [Chlorobiota bacterium]
MITVLNNYSLKNHNTFNIDISASKFVEVTRVQDLIYHFNHRDDNGLPILVLGGGSNVLFTKDFNGEVLSPVIKYIEIREENDEFVYAEAGAGVIWDDFVEFCVGKEYYGVENLSLIPGTVGAAPVQNIGAYGAEAANVIQEVKGVYVDSGDSFVFNKEQCRFGYRASIFKKSLKGKVVITSVLFRLYKNAKLNIDYGDIKKKLEEYGSDDIYSVRKAIVEIRRSKLPDPGETGNAGSFFKNPEITAEHFNELKLKYPSMPGYKSEYGMIKVPAGWLIDKAGWKGKNMGRAGVNPRQALVLVNLGGATGNDILRLAEAIENDINEKFGIRLEKEVNVI